MNPNVSSSPDVPELKRARELQDRLHAIGGPLYTAAGRFECALEDFRCARRHSEFNASEDPDVEAEERRCKEAVLARRRVLLLKEIERVERALRPEPVSFSGGRT